MSILKQKGLNLFFRYGTPNFKCKCTLIQLFIEDPIILCNKKYSSSLHSLFTREKSIIAKMQLHYVTLFRRTIEHITTNYYFHHTKGHLTTNYMQKILIRLPLIRIRASEVYLHSPTHPVSRKTRNE